MIPDPVPVPACLLLCGAPAAEPGPPSCPSPASPAAQAALPTDGSDPCTAAPTEAAVPATTRSAVAGPSPSHDPAPPTSTPTPVVHLTVGASDSASPLSRALGHASTALLAVLGVAVLAARLSVGWPRFPVPYLGRRRRGVDRESP